jgi:hypothetical protein
VLRIEDNDPGLRVVLALPLALASAPPANGEVPKKGA